MGFLDRLVRQEIRKGVGGLVSGAIVDAINNSSTSNNTSAAPQYQSTGVNHDTDGANTYTYTDPNLAANYDPTNQYNYNYAEVQTGTTVNQNTTSSLSYGNAEENFYTLFCSEFPDYKIFRNVSAASFGASQYAGNYTFGFYKDGEPKLFVMLVPHNKYRNRPYAHAKEASLRNGIPFMFYFLHFENNRDYVINRTREALR